MSLDFLVPIVTYPDPTAKAGLGRAIDMAASITGRLSLLAQEVDIPPIHNVVAETLVKVSALAAEAERKSRESAGEIAAEAEYLARRMMLPVTTSSLPARPDDTMDRMVEAARLHDATLFVLDPASEFQSALAEAILFGSGGPLLLCPADDRGGHLRSVVIAWEEAGRRRGHCATPSLYCGWPGRRRSLPLTKTSPSTRRGSSASGRSLSTTGFTASITPFASMAAPSAKRCRATRSRPEQASW
jgi:hypothetical protein